MRLNFIDAKLNLFLYYKQPSKKKLNGVKSHEQEGGILITKAIEYMTNYGSSPVQSIHSSLCHHSASVAALNEFH